MTDPLHRHGARPAGGGAGADPQVVHWLLRNALKPKALAKLAGEVGLEFPDTSFAGCATVSRALGFHLASSRRPRP